ncbi:helix-turn-helix domain-containing protein [Nocardia sp. NPDC052254]|uniref:PucR family transcriptional regulator n=1 Tax=Nocardia sp. NPDC052254 TaxID=3155681 RepID=UPI003436CDB8
MSPTLDLATVTRLCAEFAVDVLDGKPVTDTPRVLMRAATQWARERTPLDSIHRAVHLGFRRGAERWHAATIFTDLETTEAATLRLLDAVETITTAVSTAYIDELRDATDGGYNPAHRLAAALLHGHPTAALARQSGIAVADHYHVVAVSLSLPETSLAGRRTLHRARIALNSHSSGGTLSLLNASGGTILIPAPPTVTEDVDRIVAAVSAVTGAPITATTAPAAASDIPACFEEVHELLDTVERLGREPGVYRLDDLALEHQLTRPGPSRNLLSSMLNPLDEHPELIETITRHLANDLNRQRTAHDLRVHTNTVDYRMKRIGQLIGIDPTSASGLLYVRAALVARTYTENPPMPERIRPDTGARTPRRVIAARPKPRTQR